MVIQSVDSLPKTRVCNPFADDLCLMLQRAAEVLQGGGFPIFWGKEAEATRIGCEAVELIGQDRSALEVSVWNGDRLIARLLILDGEEDSDEGPEVIALDRKALV